MALAEDGGRALSTFEDIMDAHQSVGNYIFTCSLMLKVSGMLEGDDVRNVLLNLQKRHPLLRMKINSTGDSRQFQPMQTNSIDFEVFTTDDWQAVNEELLGTKFNTEAGPLWRVKLLRLTNPNTKDSSDNDDERVALLFAFHHSIADGVSVAKLLQEFVEMTDCSMSNKQIDDWTPLPLLLSMKHQLPPRDSVFRCMDVFKLVGMAKKNYLPGKNLFLERYPALVTENPAVKSQTRMVAFNLSKTDTETLLAKCKRERTTVHGALTAAAALSLRDIIQPNEKKSLLMPTLHPVNMRHFCKPPLEPQHLGYMVLTVDTTLKVPKWGTFWGFARKNSQRIHSALVSNDHMTLLRIGDKVWNRDDYLRKVADSQKDGGRNPNYFTLSNIGNLDKILNTCFVNLEVEDVLTSTGIHAEGPLFLHNVLTFKNQLRWHLNYAANVIHRQQALDHAARIEKILVEAVRGPDTQKQNVNQQQVTHLFQSNGIAQQKIRERNMPQQSSRYSSVNSEVLDSKGHWVEKQDRRLPRINVVPCPSNRIQYWPYTELPHTKINQNSVTHANMSSTQGYAHGKIPWSSKDLAFVRPYKVLPSYRQPSKAGVYNINQISPLTSAWSSYACGPVPHFLPRRRAPENLKFFW